MAQQKVEIEVVDAGAYTVLRPAGDLDVYTVRSLRDALAKLIEDSVSRVVVDLDGVRFMDSSGLGSLMGGVRRVREAGGDVAIACTVDHHLKLIGIVDRADEVAIESSVEEAAKALAK